MAVFQRIKALWRNLTHRQSVENDLTEEIYSYREMLEDEKVRAGADSVTARREALMELGGAEQIKEEVRDVRAGSSLEGMGTEFRQAARGLRRNPGLAVLGTAMLALGMGATTAIFSIFRAALLEPLPFRDPGRLVQLWETRQTRGIDQASVSEANFWDVRARSRAFQELAARHYDEANLTGAGPAERVAVNSVTAGFFRVLGVSPALGRDFSYDDDRGGWDNHLALLGNRFWRSRFGADPNILGRNLRLNGKAFTVVGVLPPGEPWIDGQVYVPFGYRASANRGSWEFDVIGRLAPGVSPEAARADLQRIAAVLGQSYPADDKGIGFRLESSDTWVARASTRRGLWMLLGAVALLLLIACLNIANLLLARGSARQREIAVRTALGAGRARLVRFVMLESLLISGLGAALGIGLAYAALRAVKAMEISGIPRLADAGIDPRVLGFAALVAVLTGLLSGVAPALQAPVGQIAAALREGDRQTGSRSQGRMRAALVAGEVALSFLLLVGAGLLIRSFSELTSVDCGFRTENRLLFSVSMPDAYWEKGVGKQFVDGFVERLSALPGVVAVGVVSHRPVEGGDPGMNIDSVPQQRTAPWAGWRIVSPGYFRAVGLPLLRGRIFDGNDKPVWAAPGQPPPPRRVVISHRLANLLFPGQDAVGKRVVLWKGLANLDAEVIGVAGDSRERGPAASPALTVYVPYGSNALPGEFVLHTSGNPLALVPAVRSILAGFDPDLPIADVRPFNEVVSRSLAPQRFNAVLLGIFSGLALLLAIVGIYAVLSYSMSRRTAEIGLRVALGATGRGILYMALVQGMRPALVGIAAGAAGAAWLSRYFVSLLFGVKPLDLTIYLSVAGLLLLTAAAACYLPGRRAMRIDPATALRLE